MGGLDPPFSKMKVSKAMKELDGNIIECKYEKNAWVFMRERTDKSFPNSFTTAQCKYYCVAYLVAVEFVLGKVSPKISLGNLKVGISLYYC